mmetsp:Transcript_30797/g.69451  ORF Transcript_30797/g.69451 Transcript_30797/m.69451 type:complete len:675 (+) Transcript_30797:4487-6511(+)
MHGHHVQGNALPVLLRQLDFSEKPVGDRLQGLGRPWLEPVDHCVVDHARKVAASAAEIFADRRHGEDNVQVVSRGFHEVVPAGVLAVREALLLHLTPHRVDDPLSLVLCVQRGHHAHGEEVVDQFEEAFVRHVLVGEQEDYGLCLEHAVHRPKVLPELFFPVRPRQSDLENLTLSSVGRELCERLLARPSDAHEQRVPSRQPQQTVKATEVLKGIIEEDEVHNLVGLVVSLEQLVEERLDLVVSSQVFVHSSFSLSFDHAESVLEVPEHDLSLHRTVCVVGKLLLHDLLQLLNEPILVLLRDQPVMEDAQAFVPPESANCDPVKNGVCRGGAEPFTDSRQVTEVEDVVEASGSGRHVGDDSLVKFQRRFREHLPAGLEEFSVLGRGEGLEMAVKDGGEDSDDGLIGGEGDVEDSEERYESGIHRIASSARRAAGSQAVGIDDVLPNELFPVVEPLLLYEELEQRDRLLGPVSVNKRHVNVVNEDDQLPSRGRAECPLEPLLNVALYVDLQVLAGGSGGEGDVEEVVGLWVEILQVVLQRHRLGRPRLPDKDGRARDLDAGVYQPCAPYRVGGRNEDLVEGLARRRAEFLHQAAPRRPAAHLGIVHVVEDGGLGGSWKAGDTDRRLIRPAHARQLLEMGVESLPAVLVQRGAERPGQARDEDRLELLRLGVFRLL